MPSRAATGLSQGRSSRTPSARPAGYDARLLFPVLFLVGIGIVMVYSASSALALKKYGNSYFFIKKQAMFALVGLMALVVGRHFPYRGLRLLAYPAVVLTLGLLLGRALDRFRSFGRRRHPLAAYRRLYPAARGTGPYGHDSLPGVLDE